MFTGAGSKAILRFLAKEVEGATVGCSVETGGRVFDEFGSSQLAGPKDVGLDPGGVGWTTVQQIEGDLGVCVFRLRAGTGFKSHGFEGPDETIQ